MTEYTIFIPYNQFREYLVETDESGPWSDKYFADTFDKYVEDDSIMIEYKYGEYKNGKSMIKWRVADTEKIRAVRYTNSSIFAMWWCGITDGIEDEEEDEDQEDAVEEATCVVCNETKTEDWAWNTTPVLNAPVCSDCLEAR
jgi:hypothetical protein